MVSSDPRKAQRGRIMVLASIKRKGMSIVKAKGQFPRKVVSIQLFDQSINLFVLLSYYPNLEATQNTAYIF